MATGREEKSSTSRPKRGFFWLTTNPSKAVLEPLILDEVSASKETGIGERSLGRKLGLVSFLPTNPKKRRRILGWE